MIDFNSEYFIERIKEKYRRDIDGCFTAFCIETGIPASTVGCWCLGKTEPHFEALVKLMRCLSIDDIEELVKEVST
jgi:hypothetical protein